MQWEQLSSGKSAPQMHRKHEKVLDGELIHHMLGDRCILQRNQIALGILTDVAA